MYCLHLPNFFLTHTISTSIAKDKVITIAVFFTDPCSTGILPDYSSVRLGSNMNHKCQTAYSIHHVSSNTQSFNHCFFFRVKDIIKPSAMFAEKCQFFNRKKAMTK